ncbi:MAG TPA: hypothetical protein VJ991_07615 [Balneolales bacterium]|nr:hypothetical protein [Balneolales bacterium]
MPRTIIGVMGPGESATKLDISIAYELGKAIGSNGWALLTGGRKVGVMHAATLGAKEEGGITIGILPTADKKDMSPYIDIPIFTDMGSARNNINILSSKLIVVCGMSAGTSSEVSLAIKAEKHVIMLNQPTQAKNYFQFLGSKLVHTVTIPDDAIDLIKQLM